MDKKGGHTYIVFCLPYEYGQTLTISVRVTRRHARRAIVTLYETEITLRARQGERWTLWKMTQ